MFFSGDIGTNFWSNETNNPFIETFFQALLDNGFELVQVKWTGGWLNSPIGVQSGEEALACRPATAIKWVHDNWYLPMGVQPAVGQLGFGITGTSAGACQVAYAISSYGIDNIVDVAVPTAGPTMADIAKGCLQVPGYEYNPTKANFFDQSYGFTGQNGPCAAQDPSFTDAWIANSVETGGVTYNYPTTRVQIISRCRGHHPNQEPGE